MSLLPNSESLRHNHYQFRGSCLCVPTRHHVEVSNHGLVIITIAIIIVTTTIAIFLLVCPRKLPRTYHGVSFRLSFVWKRWSSRLHLIHSFTTRITRQSCSVSHWACSSLKGPSWTVCHRPSTPALILNLCDINHYQLKGSCLSVPTPHHMEVSNHGLAHHQYCRRRHHHRHHYHHYSPCQS